MEEESEESEVIPSYQTKPTETGKYSIFNYFNISATWSFFTNNTS